MWYIGDMTEIRLRVENLMDYSDAAKFLGVTRQTVHTWIKQGKFTPIEIGDRRYLLRLQVEKIKKERQKGG